MVTIGEEKIFKIFSSITSDYIQGILGTNP